MIKRRRILFSIIGLICVGAIILLAVFAPSITKEMDMWHNQNALLQKCEGMSRDTAREIVDMLAEHGAGKYLEVTCELSTQKEGAEKDLFPTNSVTVFDDKGNVYCMVFNRNWLVFRIHKDSFVGEDIYRSIPFD